MVDPPPPVPPGGLKDWVNYSLGAALPPDDCPDFQSAGSDTVSVCAALREVRLSGNPETGKLGLSFAGVNWSRNPVFLPLLGPAEVFSIDLGEVDAGDRPRLLLEGGEGGNWLAQVDPGPFVFAVSVEFDPRPSVELQLPGPIADLQNGLTGGSLRVDEQEKAWHGGAVQIETGTAATERQEPLTVRVVRLFQWGSVPTFAYHFAVSGVREQREIVLPLVGGERIETMDPDRPFKLADGALILTMAPGQAGGLVVRGHLEKVVEILSKPEGLPFEHWLFVTDQRHPVTLESDGREIDPQAVETQTLSNLTPPVGARAFFLTERQSLRIKAIPVQVDEGRGGSGRTSYLFVQGEEGHWVGNLSLTAKLPKQDRLSVRTPEAPHYADRGGTALRMFKDEQGVLSIQLDEQLAEGTPLRLQWREEKAISRLLSVLRLPLPEQAIHLDWQRAAAHLKPGYVATIGMGADDVTGHLVDHFHVFALLMGLLALVLCRAAGFRWPVAVVLALLFTSLDTVTDFPRTPLFLLLAVTAVVVRLPQRVLAGLHARKPLLYLSMVVWLVFLVVAAAPLVNFIQERVHSAIHPWSSEIKQVYVDSYSSGYLNASDFTRNVDGRFTLDSTGDLGLMQGFAAGQAGPEETVQDEGGAKDKAAHLPAAPPPPEQDLPRTRVASKAGWTGRGEPKKPMAGEEAPAEKSMRPVAFDQPHLPGSVVNFTSSSLLPGQQMTPWVLVAGPWLRGAWIFLEAILLVGLIFLLLRASGPLWKAPPPATPEPAPQPASSPTPAAHVAALVLCFILFALGGNGGLVGIPDAHAQAGGLTVTPGTGPAFEEVLEQLASRHRPSRWCSGDCGTLLRLRIGGQLAAGKLTFQADGNVLGRAPGLVSLFGITPAAGLSQARLDGRQSIDLIWATDRYVALLQPGPFRLEGELQLRGERTATFFIPGPLGEIEFDVADAQVLGDRRRRAVQGATFQLVSQVAEEPPPTTGAPAGEIKPEAPAGSAAGRLRFLTSRTFELGRDRRFRTVIRVEGARPGQVIPFDLLPGEKVEGTEPEGASVRPEGKPRVEFTAQESSSSFSYFGEWTEPQLKLTAPEGAVRETWVVRCTDPFSCTFGGNAEVQAGARGHVWVPLPGQALEVSWRELEPLPGVHALVQEVQIDSSPRGRNLRQGMLATWTASAPVVESLHLPTGAVVTEFMLDGQPIPVLKDEQGAIKLTLPAGRSEVRAIWEMVDGGRGLIIHPPVPSFSVPVGTIRHVIYQADDRSVLWAGGLDGSPEVTFWPAAVTCVLLALFLLWILRALAGSKAGQGPTPEAARPPIAWLVILVFTGFAILSPYTLLPLLFTLAALHWMGWGGPTRGRFRVVVEVLAVLGLALVSLILAFVVLQHAFFNDAPFSVVNFAESSGKMVLSEVSGQGLLWTAGLGGAAIPIPSCWTISVPTLALRLVWFGWAILTGFLLYREGRRLMKAIAVHWSRAVWKKPASPAPSVVADSKGKAPLETTAKETKGI